MGIVLIGLELGHGGEILGALEEVVWGGRWFDDALVFLGSVCSGAIFVAWVVVVVIGGGL